MQQVLRTGLTFPTAADTVPGLIGKRRPGYSLPAGLYTRPDAFEADLEAIFHREWIAVGVEADVAEPGDVYAVDIGRSSVAIVRDDEGALRAFHNSCRHRGARIVPEGRSIVGKLVCPYHQWTYELDGTLTDAPHMGLDFDRALHHLSPVALRSIGGLIYVCLSEDPPEDIDDLAAVMGPRLQPYDLSNARIAHEMDIVEAGNWKLTIENNRECYHCASNHPELSLTFEASDFGYDPAILTRDERAETERIAALYEEKTAAWEARGLGSHAVTHVAGHATHFRTQRLIIAAGGASHTLDRRPAVRVPLGQDIAEDSGDLHLWHNNSWNHFFGDYAVVINIFPLAPDRTLVRTKWLVHRDAVEGKDYELENLIAVWRETNAQDGALVGLAHAGVQSAGYRPGPYSRFTEQTLDDFATWYVERMTAHGWGP